MKSIIMTLCLFALIPATIAAENNANEAERKLLKSILNDFETSLNEKDLSKMLSHLDDQAVMAFMTTETAVGKDAIVAFYDKMFKGPNAPLSDQKTKASIDGEAIFHGNTIVASGRTQDVFTLKNGTVYDFDTRWVATVVKKNGNWKVVSVDFSVDPFNNVVLDEVQAKVWTYSIAALIAGLLIAFFAGRMRKK